jgi:hypothetical protein
MGYFQCECRSRLHLLPGELATRNVGFHDNYDMLSVSLLKLPTFNRLAGLRLDGRASGNYLQSFTFQAEEPFSPPFRGWKRQCAIAIVRALKRYNPFLFE